MVNIQFKRYLYVRRWPLDGIVIMVGLGMPKGRLSHGSFNSVVACIPDLGWSVGSGTLAGAEESGRG